MNTNTNKILELWHYAEGLKLEERAVHLSNGRHESVAEHCWRMAFMVISIAPRLEKKINLERALKMAIIHDISEVEAGDIPSLIHFGNHDIKSKKDADEKAAMDNIQKKFGDMGEEIAVLWQEYEDQKTTEAKVIKALDKLDARVQAVDDESMANFSAESKATVGRLSKYTEELCGIDSLLIDLDSLSLKERQEKWGF